MKKIIFIFGLLFSVQFVFSQNLVLTGGDYFNSDPLLDISHHLDLKNNANYAITNSFLILLYWHKNRV